MANENAPIGQVNAANLIGQFKPQTDATSNFVQALRAGVITANDIQQGVDRHQQSKVQLSAQQLALAEASSPDAMAAKQAQNQLLAATAKAQLPLVEGQAQLQDYTAKAAMWGAGLKALGSSPQEVAQQNALGYKVPEDVQRPPDKGLLAMIVSNRETIKRHSNTGQYVGAEINEGHVDVNGRIIPFWKTKQTPLSASELAELADFKKYAKDPVGWDLAGRPGESLWSGVKPGAVAAPAPAAPVVEERSISAPAPTPEETAKLRALVVQRGLIKSVGDPGMAVLHANALNHDQLSELLRASAPAAPQVVVQPKTAQPAPAARAVVQPKTNPYEIEVQPGVFKTVVPTQAEKDMTERQSNFGLGLTRMVQAEQTLDRLSGKKFNPASNWVWWQTRFPNWPILGDIRTQETRSFQSAKDLWDQGLLRLESGAAIAHKEQMWYETTFFPSRGDGAQVMEQKRQSRLAIMNWMHEVLSKKLVNGPEGGLQASYDAFSLTQKAQVDAVREGAPVKMTGGPEEYPFKGYKLVKNSQGTYDRVGTPQ